MTLNVTPAPIVNHHNKLTIFVPGNNTSIVTVVKNSAVALKCCLIVFVLGIMSFGTAKSAYK